MIEIAQTDIEGIFKCFGDGYYIGIAKAPCECSA